MRKRRARGGKGDPLVLNMTRISLFGCTENSKYCRVTILKSSMCICVELVHKHDMVMIDKEIIKNS